MSVKKLVVGGVAALLAAVTLAGCPPGICGTTSQRISFHDFEADCGDATCGLSLVTGQATPAAAFTTGEHALQVSAGAVLQLATGARLTGEREFVALLARCDPGARIRVEETLALTRAADGGAPASETVTHAVDLTVGEAWQSLREDFPAHGTPGSNLQRGDGGAPPASATLTRWQLRVDGVGSCTVDDVEFGERLVPLCAL